MVSPFVLSSPPEDESSRVSLRGKLRNAALAWALAQLLCPVRSPDPDPLPVLCPGGGQGGGRGEGKAEGPRTTLNPQGSILYLVSVFGPRLEWRENPKANYAYS